jgi:hypothetical protein
MTRENAKIEKQEYLEVILTIELHRGFSKSKQIMSKLIFRVHRLYIEKTEKQTQ